MDYFDSIRPQTPLDRLESIQALGHEVGGLRANQQDAQSTKISPDGQMEMMLSEVHGSAATASVSGSPQLSPTISPTDMLYPATGRSSAPSTMWPDSHGLILSDRQGDHLQSQRSIQAEFRKGSVGIVFGQQEDHSLYVERVVPGGPADVAGIITGDILCKVNGRYVIGASLPSLASVIPGPVGSIVTLMMRRKESRNGVLGHSYFEASLVRESIEGMAFRDMLHQSPPKSSSHTNHQSNHNIAASLDVPPVHKQISPSSREQMLENQPAARSMDPFGHAENEHSGSVAPTANVKAQGFPSQIKMQSGHASQSPEDFAAVMTERDSKSGDAIDVRLSASSSEVSLDVRPNIAMRQLNSNVHHKDDHRLRKTGAPDGISKNLSSSQEIEDELANMNGLPQSPAAADRQSVSAPAPTPAAARQQDLNPEMFNSHGSMNSEAKNNASTTVQQPTSGLAFSSSRADSTASPSAFASRKAPHRKYFSRNAESEQVGSEDDSDAVSDPETHSGSKMSVDDNDANCTGSSDDDGLSCIANMNFDVKDGVLKLSAKEVQVLLKEISELRKRAEGRKNDDSADGTQALGSNSKQCPKCRQYRRRIIQLQEDSARKKLSLSPANASTNHHVQSNSQKRHSTSRSPIRDEIANLKQLQRGLEVRLDVEVGRRHDAEQRQQQSENMVKKLAQDVDRLQLQNQMLIARENRARELKQTGKGLGGAANSKPSSNTVPSVASSMDSRNAVPEAKVLYSSVASAAARNTGSSSGQVLSGPSPVLAAKQGIAFKDFGGTTRKPVSGAPFNTNLNKRGSIPAAEGAHHKFQSTSEVQHPVSAQSNAWLPAQSARSSGAQTARGHSRPNTAGMGGYGSGSQSARMSWGPGDRQMPLSKPITQYPTERDGDVVKYQNPAVMRRSTGAIAQKQANMKAKSKAPALSVRRTAPHRSWQDEETTMV